MEILSRLIIPFGIVAYTLLLATFITGLRRMKLKYHKRLAFAAIILASLHALLVLFLELHE